VNPKNFYLAQNKKARAHPLQNIPVIVGLVLTAKTNLTIQNHQA
jgi:hypothetical protein